MSNDLHAPTLRHVIEILDGEIATSQATATEAPNNFGRAWYTGRTVGLRVFRERLEREAERVEANHD